MQCMDHIDNQNGYHNQLLPPPFEPPPPLPPRQIRDNILECFCILHPDRFNGLVETQRAEQWLREMEMIFEAIECSEQDKQQLAVFQLTFSAADWWASEKAMMGAEAIRIMTWEAFKARFLEKYFPEEERDQQEKDFLGLAEGHMTVKEYTMQFECLSRFA